MSRTSRPDAKASGPDRKRSPGAITRHARVLVKHVEKLLNHQRDIISATGLSEINAAIVEVRTAVAQRSEPDVIQKSSDALEKTATKWLKPYPYPNFRENIEVLLVALTIALAIRTFFLQPFKIPTGSMQPTLYGVTSKNLREIPDAKIPTGFERMKEWFRGTSYVHVKADRDGVFVGAEPPFRILIFSIYQKIHFGGDVKWIWFPPDYGQESLEQRAGIDRGQSFRAGEDIVKLQVNAGDHLFVDRVSYNFRVPERGEIIVFETKGIPPERRGNIPPDQFYIKRLCGLGGETLTIQKELEVEKVPNFPFQSVMAGRLVVNGNPLSASTPHFELLYSFDALPRNGAPTVLYRENRYYGHAMIQRLAEGREFKVSPDSLFVMGDNTMNSQDSRYFGDFPSRVVIGKSFFVYWPISSRFGLSTISH